MNDRFVDFERIQSSNRYYEKRYKVLYLYDECNTQNGRVVNPTNAIDSIDSLTV